MITVPTRWHVSHTVQTISFEALCFSSRLSSAKASAPIILDGKKLSEDEEDEQFLVEEAVPQPLDVPEMELVSDSNSELMKCRGET